MLLPSTWLTFLRHRSVQDRLLSTPKLSSACSGFLLTSKIPQFVVSRTLVAALLLVLSLTTVMLVLSARLLASRVLPQAP